MLSLLDDIIEGRATVETLDILEDLAEMVQKGSLCGLGKVRAQPGPFHAAPFPRRIRGAREAQVLSHGQMQGFTQSEIDPELCRGCTLCAKKCPVNAISGEKGKTHHIDQTICTTCGTCVRDLQVPGNKRGTDYDGGDEA